MARLSLSTFINAPPEAVFEHLTAFGRDGPTGDETFTRKYGKVLSLEGNVFVVQEEEQKYEDEKPERITWRCTFEYPQRRTMEAVDSLWADRVDILRPTNGGTRWTIRWYTKTGGVRGIIQYLVFRLVGHRRLRKSTIDPVKSHFEGQGAQQ